ncbi:MAG: 3'(2'),5'-bisphosphate nucleotidase CysQ [Bacteroidota bacterium]|nr:3'(2'),5'-bisphosphate nucleotidase CysQ [Bacteroidota bacterium]MDX5428936.1 3'(2'),5'-bisphosphate nucleotidase CysQ [Bacteroidota bacterium]MDX5447993.1 3'(2'),5'-bisphosphate nucleotidase CysQ [Bacteroidota bacterium]MDX5506616.1 3'(2'),5'-bisphosphate nucleotidase CysQ [Bacteroidota bacterium]
MDIKQLLIIAVKAAVTGGKAIMEVYTSDDFETEIKSDNTPLTRADKLAHQAIMEHLEETGIPVLSEEGRDIPYSERSKWDTLWVVDPLDGTKEFIKQNGEFTVNIALVEKGRPVAGVIYVPAKRDLYFGGESVGSYKIERVGSNSEIPDFDTLAGASSKLPREEPEGFMVVASRSHLSQETQDYIDKLRESHPDLEMVSAGSALKLCLVAEGVAQVYPRFAPTMEWDTAAGHAIALGAGASVVKTDEQTPLTYNKENLLNPHFIVKRETSSENSVL